MNTKFDRSFVASALIHLARPAIKPIAIKNITGSSAEMTGLFTGVQSKKEKRNGAYFHPLYAGGARHPVKPVPSEKNHDAAHLGPVCVATDETH
jgi:hypothetical protein